MQMRVASLRQVRRPTEAAERPTTTPNHTPRRIDVPNIIPLRPDQPSSANVTARCITETPFKRETDRLGVAKPAQALESRRCALGRKGGFETK